MDILSIEPRQRAVEMGLMFKFVKSRLIFGGPLRRASRKAELGRYLSAIDWPPLFSSLDCFEDMLNAFYKALRTGLDLLMPVKKVRVNTSDVPWMTKHLKSLTLKRQKAFHEHGIN